MRIRPLIAADRPAVVALVREVLSEHGFDFEQVGSLERDFDALDERYHGGDGGFWVVEIDGAIVGTVAVRPKEGRTCEIKRLYLGASRRGQGLGQALYAHAERFARAAGYERIWLDSSRRFERAHRLYQKNGFVLVEQLDNAWEDSVYEKDLTAAAEA
jgi:GNAT superfamily N-acetyltransferase